MSYIYIFLMLIFTVYRQVILKWVIVQNAYKAPTGTISKLWFYVKLLPNPWVISAIMAIILSSLFWIAALEKMELSVAYPYLSLSFVMILILSSVIFNESLNWAKIAGTVVIMIGMIIISQKW